MDFAGLGRFAAYKVDRPLDGREKASRLGQRRKTVDPARDELSVIKVNSIYMELVDRWYAPKGGGSEGKWLGLVPAVRTTRPSKSKTKHFRVQWAK